MKTILSSIFAISFLTACSAGAQQSDKQASFMAQADMPTTSFVVSFTGHTGSVEGQGMTDKDAAYDAVAWLVTNVYKAGTQEYRDMITDKGLTVMLIKNPQDKFTYVANVKLGRDCIGRCYGKAVIDVVVVGNA